MTNSSIDSRTTAWVVEIQASSPDDQLEDDLIAQLTSCISLLGQDKSSGTCDEDGWALSLCIPAEDARAAWNLGMNMAFEAAMTSGLPLWPIASISVIDGEYAASMSRWFHSDHIAT
jgi:hypothetical protein